MLPFKNYFSLGVNLIFLTTLNPSKLSRSRNNFGLYYAAQPVLNLKIYFDRGKRSCKKQVHIVISRVGEKMIDICITAYKYNHEDYYK